ELLEGITQFALSPTQAKRRTATKGTGDKAAEVTLEPVDSGEFVGQVFKIINDKFIGNLSFIRVLAGKLTPEQPIVNPRTGQSPRWGGLITMQGKTQKSATDAIPGDIVAVAKVEELAIGDTVGTTTHAPKLPAPAFPTPMYGLAVEPKARGDEQKISMSLHKI